METKNSRLRLYFSAFILNLNYLLCGVGFAWSSPVLMKLTLTDTEGSSVASMLSLGSILGPLASGLLLDMLGRKGTVGLNMALMAAGYLLLTFGEGLTALSIGRFVAGITVGISFSALPIYIAEISEDSVRGFLNTLSQIFCCSGSLFIYGVGPYVSYAVLHYFILAVVGALLLMFPLLPDSPHYLVMKGNTAGARKCLTWLREGQSSEAIESELRVIRNTLDESRAEKGGVRDLLMVPGNRRALGICSMLISTMQFSGITIIFCYTEKILRMSGSDIDSRTSSMLIGIVMLLSAFIAPITVKYLGYKKPLLLSCVGMSLGTGGLGVYFMLKFYEFQVDSINWLPMTGIIVYVLFLNTGVGNIPWALVGEMFPSNVKPTAATFVAIVNGLLAFATSNLFPELLHYLGIDILFLTCSLLSLLGGVFTLAAVTDTSKMSFQEIQDMLGGKSRQVGEKSEQSQLVRSVA